MTEKKFNYFISGIKAKWEVIIGLEVHAQVLSKSKLFSSSSTKFGSDPNTQVSLVDSGFPGMLPVINQFCVEQSIKTGLGLKAKINFVKDYAQVEILDKETGISPGQACVFYSKDSFGDKVLGGGWIDKTFNNKLST